MLILFDNNVPRGLARALPEWRFTRVAEDAGFQVMVTSDKGIKYQQNLEGRTIALVVLTQGRWGLIRKRLAEIAAAVNAATPGSYAEVEIPFE